MTRPAEVKKFKAPGPTYDRNALYLVMDSYDFVYEPREPFEKIDICKPGHFNGYRDDLRLGSRITCRLGDIATGITEIELQIIEWSRSEHEGDIIVAVGPSRKFTPVRHDGTLAEDKEKEVAA